MKIHYFSNESWEEGRAKAELPGDEIIFHNGALSAFPDLADENAEALCVFMDSKIGEAELSRFPALKLIATRSTGFDHIDKDATKARGITVCNVPFYGENTVAEFTFALLLALSRRIIDADESVRSGAFSPQGLRGFDLSGKTIGVLGTGHIGAHVIKMAQGFNMMVVAYDAFRNEELAESMSFSYASLDDLLAQSDIITVHVPYNEHTHHLINKQNVEKMKKGVHIINTARGGVIETDALVDGLKNGIIAGAALDVLEEEGELADETVLLSQAHPNQEKMRLTLENHYLINHPRVIVTPHLAFNTQEAVERIFSTTIENIKNFANGSPTNVVKL